MLKLNYGQFTGIVQVMKAVGHHMVLTFCNNLPYSQFFSIVLSRHHNTLSADVRKFLILHIKHNFFS